MRIGIIIAALVGLLSCSDDTGIPGYRALGEHVKRNRVGDGADFWVEQRSISNEWERVALVFGYLDDYQGCLSAVDGFQEANHEREYRCVPAN